MDGKIVFTLKRNDVRFEVSTYKPEAAEHLFDIMLQSSRNDALQQARSRENFVEIERKESVKTITKSVTVCSRSSSEGGERTNFKKYEKKLQTIHEVTKQRSSSYPRNQDPKNTVVASNVPSDPKKPRAQEQEMARPKKVQILTILQNSQHYKELSSTHKMVANEIVAELEKELKAFHAKPTLNKIFDLTFIFRRPKLQQVLMGLGVFVNNKGEIEHFEQEVQPTQMITNQSSPTYSQHSDHHLKEMEGGRSQEPSTK